MKYCLFTRAYQRGCCHINSRAKPSSLPYADGERKHCRLAACAPCVLSKVRILIVLADGGKPYCRGGRLLCLARRARQVDLKVNVKRWWNRIEAASHGHLESGMRTALDCQAIQFARRARA